MRIVQSQLSRVDVVKAYVTYDRRKKATSKPSELNFHGWDWDYADAIDEQLAKHGLKSGILSGYLLWDQVELSMTDLYSCAVVDTLATELGQASRTLGYLRESLSSWEPKKDAHNNQEPPWLKTVIQGMPFDEASPFLLRPAVSAEAPASWYLEDGSGRATALVKYEDKFIGCPVIGYGFLAVIPDKSSTFMNRHFPSLLK